MNRTTGFWAVMVCISAAVAMAAAAPAGAHAAGARGGARSRGKLTVRVAGLPPGQAAALRLTGPPQAARGGRLRRHLTPRGVKSTLRLAPGRYRLSVSPVVIARKHGAIERGATAKPTRHRLRVTVAADRSKTVTVRYGSILNPGVRDVSHSIARVLGSPTEPSAVVLKPSVRVQVGQVLSSKPNAKLPHGLLARAIEVSGTDQEQVVLRGASIYEVAPSFTFDVPVTVTESASASQIAQCSTSTSAPGASPFVKLTNFHVSGGWTTSHIGFVNVKTGASAELHFDASAGVKVSTSAALKCELKLPSLGFQGMAGPIPVYGGIRPGASASISGSASMTSEGTTEVTLGVKAGGLPPHASPILGFSTPKFKVSSDVSAEIKAGLSLAAELGVGAENAANLHVDLTNSVNFSGKPGECSWDLDLGAFSATGEIGPLSISTPSTPSIHKNLWHSACGAPPPPPPPPAPTPTPAPAGPALPLTRAALWWLTDADLDLYAWDEYGNLVSYYQREGIPYTELVEDVIPIEGETVHAPEVFRETAVPGRHYTFGICDYHRFGGAVTLEVFDPDGAVRRFPEYLAEEGEGFIVTTSPLGIPFEPEPGWCHYASEFDGIDEFE
jgi:hypothetical protein